MIYLTKFTHVYSNKKLHISNKYNHNMPSKLLSLVTWPRRMLVSRAFGYLLPSEDWLWARLISLTLFHMLLNISH